MSDRLDKTEPAWVQAAALGVRTAMQRILNA